MRRPISIFTSGLFIERQVDAVALPAFQQVIARHSDQKCSQRTTRRVKLIRAADQHHENLLGYFFGDGRVSAHAQRKAVDRALSPAIQGREALFLAGLHAPQQIVIGWVLDGPHPLS